jgi:hypothetical protein
MSDLRVPDVIQKEDRLFFSFTLAEIEGVFAILALSAKALDRGIDVSDVEDLENVTKESAWEALDLFYSKLQSEIAEQKLGRHDEYGGAS